MATTTTIYADTDANLRENAPDTNYSGNSLIRVGQFSANRRHALFSFDVSAISAQDIVSCFFSLTVDGGSGNRTMKLVRLNQSFVEAETTWNSASTGVAWTGGGGAEGNGEFTQTTYDVTIDGSTNPSIDIKDLVIDAITRRSGTLLMVLCFDPDDSATDNGKSYFFPSEDTTPSNRPQISVVVANRVVWDGDIDGDASDGRNWVGDVAPTTNDIVIFNSTSAVDVTTGTLSCYSCFIHEEYVGDIGGASTAIALASDTSLSGGKFVINKKRGMFNFSENSDSGRDVFVINTSGDESTFTNAKGEYTTFVDATRSNFNAVGDSSLIMSFNSNSKNVSTSGQKTDLRIGGGKLLVENGFDSGVFSNTKCTCKGGDCFSRGDSYIVNKSTIFLNSDSTGADIHVMNGKLTLKNNENSNIATEDIYLWKNGIYDSRTLTGSWVPSASPSIEIRGGGNFAVDTGRSVTISN